MQLAWYAVRLICWIRAGCVGELSYMISVFGKTVPVLLHQYYQILNILNIDWKFWTDSEHSEQWLKILNRFWTFWTVSEQNLNIVGSRLVQWVRALNLTTNTSLSPIRRGFTPNFEITNKGAIDSQSQVIKFTSCLPRVGGSIRVLGFLHH
jgi:hypothetical protein